MPRSRSPSPVIRDKKKKKRDRSRTPRAHKSRDQCDLCGEEKQKRGMRHNAVLCTLCSKSICSTVIRQHRETAHFHCNECTGVFDSKEQHEQKRPISVCKFCAASTCCMPRHLARFHHHCQDCRTWYASRGDHPEQKTCDYCQKLLCGPLWKHVRDHPECKPPARVTYTGPLATAASVMPRFGTRYRNVVRADGVTTRELYHYPLAVRQEEPAAENASDAESAKSSSSSSPSNSSALSKV